MARRYAGYRALANRSQALPEAALAVSWVNVLHSAIRHFPETTNAKRSFDGGKEFSADIGRLTTLGSDPALWETRDHISRSGKMVFTSYVRTSSRFLPFVNE